MKPLLNCEVKPQKLQDSKFEFYSIFSTHIKIRVIEPTEIIAHIMFQKCQKEDLKRKKEKEKQK